MWRAMTAGYCWAETCIEGWSG